MVRRLFITVKGRVQGVGFRAYTTSLASRLGLYGYCMNMENGDVFIDAQGEEKDLDLFLAGVRSGPRLSIVEEVIVEERANLENYVDFYIRR